VRGPLARLVVEQAGVVPRAGVRLQEGPGFVAEASEGVGSAGEAGSAGVA
jgi:hypothetical protein